MARLKTVALAAALVVAVTACSGGGGHDSAAPATTTSTGRRPLSARIVMPVKTMAAGSTVNARVVVVNRTGAPLHVTACGSPFAVALANDAITPDVMWTLCALPITIPTGTSVHVVPVQALFLSCSVTSTPPCENGQEPPLPAGRYRATLYQQPKVVPDPRTVPVRVTR